MKQSMSPYALPEGVQADLARVLAYWQGLKRGDNRIPVWDDVNLSALPDLSARLMLIEVFEKPTRLRFAMVGADIRARYRGDLEGKFADEVEARDPLRYLASQASATLESCGPTHYRRAAGEEPHPAHGYSRLLLPMWGDGHIGMLLAAFVWE